MGETRVTKFVIERRQHEAAGVLKDTVRPERVTPTYRWMETLLGRLRGDDGQDTRQPISTLGYATALS